MVKLVIAEKPSLAKAIRDVVGGSYEVTSCIGHLLELAPPEDYDKKWSSWSVEHLPIRVERWRLVPKPSTAAQLRKVGEAIGRATEIIHAGDPGREGQLLVDEVLEHFGWHGPTKRVLINATDESTIRKAFARLEENTKYEPLLRAAQCRQQADWLVGMNLSRAVTKLLSDGAVISIGRVQTPTLGLLVRRAREIANFKAQAFYTLRARVALQGGAEIEMRHEPDPRLLNQAKAKAMAKEIAGQRSELSVATRPGVRRAPLPFDLAAFQAAAESLFGWGAAQSLKNLQEAYDAKLTSYPRTECRYLPSDHAGDALRIAKAVGGPIRVSPSLLALAKPSPRIYDSAKVGEHHGIVPTGIVPAMDAPQLVRRTWALVSLQFIASLLPDEAFDETVMKAKFVVAGEPAPIAFTAKGETPKNPGSSWADLDMHAPFGKKRKERETVVLPPARDKQPCLAKGCQAVEGKTTPPKPYSEASLIADMRAVAKFVDDPVLKAKLKETSGIGTAATQAPIIETLKNRGFARTAGRVIEPTELGCQVIDAIPPRLADPGVTAAWEDALGLIAEGKYPPSEFMQGINSMVAARLRETHRLRDAGARITAAGPKKRANRAQPASVRAQAPRPGPRTFSRTARRSAP